MADQNDTFMRELEEELRRERIEKIWREYGTYIIAAVVLVVVVIVGWEFYVNRRTAAAEATGARYEEALALANDSKAGSAGAEFEKLTTDGTGGYPTLARLQLAGALLDQGKTAEALAAYEALAKDGSADPLLGDYAALQAAGMRLGEADFTEMQNRLTPLIGDESPWHFSAREMLGIAAFKAGNATEARALLTPLLLDQKTPRSIAERAQIVMAEIAADEIAKKDAAGSPAAPAGAAAAADAPKDAAKDAPAPGAAPVEPAPAAAKAPEGKN
jgi:hypothetical protein